MKKITLSLLSLLIAHQSSALIGEYLESAAVPVGICSLKMDMKTASRDIEEFGYCSGVLLDSKTILTASHCFKKPLKSVSITCKIGNKKKFLSDKLKSKTKTESGDLDSIDFHPTYVLNWEKEKRDIDSNKHVIQSNAENEYDRLKKDGKRKSLEALIRKETAKFKLFRWAVATDIAKIELKKPIKLNSYMTVLTNLNHIRSLISNGSCYLTGAGKTDDDIFSEGWRGAGTLRASLSPRSSSYNADRKTLSVNGLNAARGGDSGGAYICHDPATQKNYIAGINMAAGNKNAQGLSNTSFSVFSTEENLNWLNL